MPLTTREPRAHSARSARRGRSVARGLREPPLVAGTLRNDAENLVRWIRDPQAVEPGTVMPRLGVSEADARDIASHLYRLR